MLQAWVVRSMCNLENKIVSVERILQYISIPEEPPLSMSEDKLPHNWPSEGEIQLRNLHVNTLFFFLLFNYVLLFFYRVVAQKFDIFAIVSELLEIQSDGKRIADSVFCQMRNEQFMLDSADP